MANRDFNAVMAPESEVKIITGYFVGVNGAAVTSFGGCIASITRAGEGDWDLVLTDAYPATDGQGKSTVLFADATVDTAINDDAKVSAYLPESKTLTISGYTGATTADDLDGKTVRLLIIIRNSKTRRGS